MDFVQRLDPIKLVGASAVISFLCSPFLGPPYNLPLFLFGIYSLENTGSSVSLQLFTGLLGVSGLYDIIYMMNTDQSGVIKLATVVLLLFKLPTFIASAMVLRERGGEIGLGVNANNLSGPSLWSMPGGYGSSERNGYQNVDEEAPAIGIAKPSNPTSLSQQAPGAYQTS